MKFSILENELRSLHLKILSGVDEFCGDSCLPLQLHDQRTYAMTG